MSGGSFDYAYGRVETFADSLAEKLKHNDEADEYGCIYGFRPETVARLREVEFFARTAASLMHDVEWLYSGDVGEDSFMERVHKK